MAEWVENKNGHAGTWSPNTRTRPSAGAKCASLMPPPIQVVIGGLVEATSGTVEVAVERGAWNWISRIGKLISIRKTANKDWLMSGVGCLYKYASESLPEAWVHVGGGELQLPFWQMSCACPCSVKPWEHLYVTELPWRKFDTVLWPSGITAGSWQGAVNISIGEWPNEKHASHWSSFPRLCVLGFRQLLDSIQYKARTLTWTCSWKGLVFTWQTGAFLFHFPWSQISCCVPSRKKFELQW